MLMREPANIRMIIVATVSRPTALLHRKKNQKQEDGTKGKNKSAR